MALTKKINLHNFVSNAVFIICAVSCLIPNQASSFHPVELWQNHANGTPKKVEINIFLHTY